MPLSWRVKLNLLLVAALGVASFVYAFTTLFQLDVIEDPYYLTARFERTSLLAANSEVAFQGVRSGQVAGVELTPSADATVVRMRMDRGSRIPQGVTATITRKSPIGQPIVALRPPEAWNGDGPYLRDGDTITATSAIFRFESVLRPLEAVLQGLDPENTGTLFAEVADAVRGRATDLQRLNRSNARILSTLEERAANLDRLVDNATTVTGTVVDHRDAFGAGITHLRQVAARLQEVRGELGTVLDEGARTVEELATLVENRTPELDCALTDLEHLTALLGTREQLDHTATWIENLEHIGVVGDSTQVAPDGETYIRGTLQFNTDNPPVQYEEPATLPEVNEVEPCR